jgi:hypothetical protein
MLHRVLGIERQARKYEVEKHIKEEGKAEINT